MMEPTTADLDMRDRQLNQGVETQTEQPKVQA